MAESDSNEGTDGEDPSSLGWCRVFLPSSGRESIWNWRPQWPHRLRFHSRRCQTLRVRSWDLVPAPWWLKGKDIPRWDSVHVSSSKWSYVLKIVRKQTKKEMKKKGSLFSIKNCLWLRTFRKNERQNWLKLDFNLTVFMLFFFLHFIHCPIFIGLFY